MPTERRVSEAAQETDFSEATVQRRVSEAAQETDFSEATVERRVSETTLEADYFEATVQRRVAEVALEVDIDLTPLPRVKHSFDINIKTGIKIAADIISSDLPIEEDLFCPDLPDRHTWWNKRYPFRKVLKVTAPPTGLPRGHPVHVAVDIKALQNQEKLRRDKSDYRIIFEKRPIVAKLVDDNTIAFPLMRGLKGGCSDIYILYYGSRERYPFGQYEEPRWPIRINPTHPWISHVFPESDWELGATPKTDEGSAMASLYVDSVLFLFRTSLEGGLFSIEDTVIDLRTDREGVKDVFFEGRNAMKLSRFRMGSIAHPGRDIKNSLLRVQMRALPTVDVGVEELVFDRFNFLGGI